MPRHCAHVSNYIIYRIFLYHLSLWEITIVLKNKKRMLMIYRNIKLTKKKLSIFTYIRGICKWRSHNKETRDLLVTILPLSILRFIDYQFLDYRMLIHPFCVSNCISHIFFFFNHLSHCNRFHTAFYNLANTFTYYECLAHITTAEPTLSLSLSLSLTYAFSLSQSLFLSLFSLTFVIT